MLLLYNYVHDNGIWLLVGASLGDRKVFPRPINNLMFVRHSINAPAL